MPQTPFTTDPKKKSRKDLAASIERSLGMTGANNRPIMMSEPLSFADRYLQAKGAPVKPTDNEDSFLTNLGEGFNQGGRSLVGGLGYAVGEGVEFLTRDADQIGSAIKDWSREVVDNSPEADNSAGQFLGSLVPSLIPTAVAVAGAPFTGGSSLAILSAGTLGLSATGSGMMEYERYKEQKGEAVDPFSKVAVGLAYGIAEYGAERIGLSKLLPKGTGKALLRGNLDAAEDAGKKILAKYAQAQPKKAAQLLKKFGQAGNIEGMQEVVTELTQNVTDRLYKDEKDTPDFRELMGNVAKAYFGGALMGSAIGPLSFGAENITHQKRREQQGFVAIAKDNTSGEAVEILGKDGEEFNVLTASGRQKKVPATSLSETVTLNNDQFRMLLKDKYDADLIQAEAEANQAKAQVEQEQQLTGAVIQRFGKQDSEGKTVLEVGQYEGRDVIVGQPDTANPDILVIFDEQSGESKMVSRGTVTDIESIPADELMQEYETTKQEIEYSLGNPVQRGEPVEIEGVRGTVTGIDTNTGDVQVELGEGDNVEYVTLPKDVIDNYRVAAVEETPEIPGQVSAEEVVDEEGNLKQPDTPNMWVNEDLSENDKAKNVRTISVKDQEYEVAEVKGKMEVSTGPMTEKDAKSLAKAINDRFPNANFEVENRTADDVFAEPDFRVVMGKTSPANDVATNLQKDENSKKSTKGAGPESVEENSESGEVSTEQTASKSSKPDGVQSEEVSGDTRGSGRRGTGKSAKGKDEGSDAGSGNAAQFDTTTNTPYSGGDDGKTKEGSDREVDRTKQSDRIQSKSEGKSETGREAVPESRNEETPGVERSEAKKSNRKESGAAEREQAESGVQVEEKTDEHKAKPTKKTKVKRRKKPNATQDEQKKSNGKQPGKKTDQGETVRFRFFDGQERTGNIVERKKGKVTINSNGINYTIDELMILDKNGRNQEVRKRLVAAMGLNADFGMAGSILASPFTPKKHNKVQAYVDQVTKGWKNPPPIEVYESMMDFALAYPGLQLDRSSEISGMWYDGKVHIIASHPQNANLKNVQETIFHEVFGHHGFRGIVNQLAQKDRKTYQEKYNELMDEVIKAYSGSDKMAKLANDYFLKDFADLTKQEQRIIAEEYIAHEAQTGVSSSLMDKVVSYIRELYRALTGQILKLNDAEIRNIIGASRRFVKVGDNYVNRKALKEARFKIVAYNGGSVDFDAFSVDAIGSGTGAMAFGWGLYFTQKEGIAKSYANLASIKNQKARIKEGAPSPVKTGLTKDDLLKALQEYKGKDGLLEEVSQLKSFLTAPKLKIGKDQKKVKKDALIDYIQNHIEQPRFVYKAVIHGNRTPDQYDFLDWEGKPTDRQRKKVLNLLEERGLKNDPIYSTIENATTGEEVYREIQAHYGYDGKLASLFLLEAGIDGNRYLSDGMFKVSEANPENFNYVVFDDSAVEIESKEVMFRRQSDEFGPNYGRVIPRDLFNESKLISVYSRFADFYSKGKLPEGFEVVRTSDDFGAALSEEGEMYSSGVDVYYNDEIVSLTMPYNAGKTSRFPLLITIESEDIWGITVFDENGELDSEFTEEFGEPSGVKNESDVAQAFKEESDFLKQLGVVGLWQVDGMLPADFEFDVIDFESGFDVSEGDLGLEAKNVRAEYQGEEITFYMPHGKAELHFEYKGSVGKVIEGFRDMSEEFRSIFPNKEIRFRRQVDTPEFKKWFGDSKVVDKSGDPLVVYHGTGADFNQFEKIKIGKNFVSSQLGFYFTNGAEPNMAKNIPFGGTASEYSFSSRVEGDAGSNVMPVFLSIQKPLLIDAKGWYSSVAAVDKQVKDIKRWLESGDYDGVIIESTDKENDGDERVYVVFEPTQIKSATGNNGQFDANNPDIRFRRQKLTEPQNPFYSNSLKALDYINMPKATGDQWKAMLMKNGAKEAELKWMGFDDFLKQNKKPVKQEVMDFFRENQVEVVDVLKSYDEDAVPVDTKYEDFQLPGGENYKELLLILPLGKDTWEEYKNQASGNTYKSSHWDEHNILAHIRFNERTGPNGEKILFIEEVQSDWAQEGRKKGFIGSFEFKQEEFERWYKQNKADEDPEWDSIVGTASFDEYREVYLDEMNDNLKKRGGVPQMPFPNTSDWIGLSAKRMIRYAAENGFDRIAWVTGDQSAERYDLSKQISKVTYTSGAKVLRAYDKKGERVLSQKLQSDDQIEDYVGKEVARRLLEQPEIKVEKSEIDKYGFSGRELSGLDLQVGGEGMKSFYDKILPSTVSKLLKKFDKSVKVESVEIGKGNSVVDVIDLENDSVFKTFNTEEAANNAIEQGIPGMPEDYMLQDRLTGGGTQQLSFEISPILSQTAMNEGMPMFMRKPVVQENKLQYGKRIDGTLRAWQDQFIDLKRLQEGKVKEGGLLTDEMNAYRKENLSKGKINLQQEQFREKYANPLIETIKNLKKNHGAGLDEVQQYIKSKHALERNADMYKRQPGKGKAQSGMTDEQANATVEAFESKVPKQAVEDLHAKIKAVNLFVLEKNVESGLISKEKFETTLKQYEFYVPLRGFAEADYDPTIFSGLGFTAKGRTSESGDPLPYLMAMAQDAIVKGEQNKVKQALFEFIKANPDARIYEIKNSWFVNTEQVDEDGNEIWQETPFKPSKEMFDAGLVKRSLDGDNQKPVFSKFTEETVTVMLNGKRVSILFKKPEVARAFKNADVDKFPKMLGWIRTYTRGLGSLYTQYSPEFSIRNFIRDMTTGLINIRNDFGAKTAADIFGSIPSALKAVRNGVVKNKFEGRDGRLYKEYIENGGLTGYSDLKDVSKFQSDLINEIEGIRKGNTKQWTYGMFQKTMKPLDQINRTFENTVRFAAFRHLRNKGVSVEEATMYAKDLTVNFNRKGNFSNFMGSLYLFFNASIQGSERLLRPFGVLGNQVAPGVKKRAIQTAVALPLMNMALSMINRLAGGEDEDGEYYYDKLNDYTRQHNLIIPNLVSDKEGDFIQIPLPYGFNILFASGDHITRMMVGKESVTESAINTLSVVLESFSPLGAPDLTTDDASFAENAVRLAAPTAVQPFIDLMINRNFAGYPIYKEPYAQGMTPRPDSEMYFSSVNPVFREISRSLNAATGGDSEVPGVIDINPETIEHLFGNLAGGLGSFAVNSFTTAAFIAEGENPFSDENIKKVPFVRSYVKHPSKSYNQQTFYEHANKIKQAEDIYKRYMGAKNRKRAIEYRKENIELFRMAPLVDRYRDQLETLRDKRKALEKMEKTKVIKGRIDKIDEMENDLYLKFNKEMNKRKDKPSKLSEIL